MITRDTKLLELLEEHPWLKEELPRINGKFRMLGTPVGKVMMKKASIAEMSRKSGMDEGELIDAIESVIAGRKQ